MPVTSTTNKPTVAGEAVRDALVVHRPEGPAAQLVLLFHGVGGDPQNLVPLGRRIAAALPHAAVLSVPGPEACDLGAGYQWFSVRGVTGHNRIDRVAEAMPRFADTVRHWQAAMGVPASYTALVGFSQGAIMSLESTQLAEPLASCVVALSGRLAQRPVVAHAGLSVHLVHGTADAVMPVAGGVDAAEQLAGLGLGATVDLVPGLGHGVNADVEKLVVERLAARFG